MEANFRPILTASVAATIAVLTLVPSGAQSDLLGVPGPIALQSDDYALAWTSQPSVGYVKQEYVPDGQDVELYQDMILVEAVSGELPPWMPPRRKSRALRHAGAATRYSTMI